jgi:hypothetical protein
VKDLSSYGKQVYGLKLEGVITGKRRLLLTFSGNPEQAKAFEDFVRNMQ